MIARRAFLAAAAAAVALPTAAQTLPEGARTGRFTGDSNHVTSGGVTFVKAQEGWLVVLGPDFFHDGAPDPKVALGKGDGKPFALIGALGALKGEQSYRVPEGTDVTGVDRIWIWCERYSVPLGHAMLN